MTLFADTLDRLFAAELTPALRRTAEAGEFPWTLWEKLQVLGVFDIFRGASDDPWADAGALFEACGRHAVPGPVAETVLASAHWPALPAGRPAGLAVVRQDGGAPIAETAWGAAAAWVLWTANDGTAWAARPAGPPVARQQALAREPRDTVPVADAAAAEPGLWERAAVMRSAQMAGAIEAVLAMSVAYAKERVQFGKPIGAFQAVQQLLALLAGEAAAARMSAAAALQALSSGRPLGVEAAIAKIRTGEAAGKAAAIAHQVHGAMGFTEEHALHVWTRRLWTWRAEFGSEAAWAARLGAELAPRDLWAAVTALG